MKLTIKRSRQASVGVFDKASSLPVGAIRQLEPGEIERHLICRLMKPPQQIGVWPSPSLNVNIAKKGGRRRGWRKDRPR